MFGDLALRLAKEARAAQLTDTIQPYNDELVRLIILETRQLQTHITGLLGEGGLSAAEANPGLAAQIVAHHAAAQRNKRCLLVYHDQRMTYLKRMLWKKGGSLDLTLHVAYDAPSRLAALAGGSGTGGNAAAAAGRGDGPQQPQQQRDSSKAGYGAQGDLSSAATSTTTLRSRLCTAELDFVRQYAALNMAYKSEFLDVLDVAGALTRSDDVDDVAPPRTLMVSVEALVDAKDVQTERGSVNLRRGERLRILRTEIEGLLVRGWVRIVEE